MNCRQLRIVILNEELEEIGARALGLCIALEEIAIPKNFRAIKRGAFNACLGLKRVILGDRLDEIGAFALGNFISMEEIVIPPPSMKYTTPHSTTDQI